MAKLKLKVPLDKISVNQRFGKNATDVYQAQGMTGHNGIDFSAKHGTPVYTSHDGFATYQIDNSGGHGVVIITDEEFESVDGVSSYWKTIYWHLVDQLKDPKYPSPIADKAQHVKAGDLIGYADNTGTSTGDHLHFGLKPVAKGESNWIWYNLEQNNGYYGAVDPAPYLDGFEEIPFKKIMSYGEKSADVAKLQAFLIRKKFLSLPFLLMSFGFLVRSQRRTVCLWKLQAGL